MQWGLLLTFCACLPTFLSKLLCLAIATLPINQPEDFNHDHQYQKFDKHDLKN